jgi:Zn finger protein HypA/HybF involved in hydrogenase expression
MEDKKEETTKPQKFRCSKCNSAQTYTNSKGRKCRKCGFLEEIKKEGDNGGAC